MKKMSRVLLLGLFTLALNSAYAVAPNFPNINETPTTTGTSTMAHPKDYKGSAAPIAPNYPHYNTTTPSYVQPSTTGTDSNSSFYKKQPSYNNPDAEVAERGLAYDWIQSRQPSYTQNENSTYFQRYWAQPYADYSSQQGNYFAQPNSNYYQPNYNDYSNYNYDNNYQPQYQYPYNR